MFCCGNHVQLEEETFECVILDSNAKVPTAATTGSAGFDLYSPSRVVIDGQCTVRLPIGVALKPPKGTYVRAVSRSGLSTKYKIFTIADVVDPDYTGGIHLCLMNASDDKYVVEKHERVGSVVFERFSHPKATVVGKVARTHRGNGNFGSTGK
jgi:dUTP pyrophosphatase